jgi:hypothetical protein
MNFDIRTYYSDTLLMLWFMHFFSFLINRNSFNKKFFDDPEIDDFKKYN